MSIISTPRISLNFQKAEFIKSASSIENAPEDTGYEVAFAGRSNSGKSSAINTLTAQRKLARTSRSPGRTQLINFFSIGETTRLVDLPGYGFAKVPLHVKKNWAVQSERYLRYRQSLMGLILLMDIRHPLTSYDQQVVAWSLAANMPVHLLLTKADKLKKGAAKASLLSTQVKLGPPNDLITIQLFSSLKSQGVEELRNKIGEWLSGNLAQFEND